jgi:hypothetical protein
VPSSSTPFSEAARGAPGSERTICFIHAASIYLPLLLLLLLQTSPFELRVLSGCLQHLSCLS